MSVVVVVFVVAFIFCCLRCCPIHRYAEDINKILLLLLLPLLPTPCIRRYVNEVHLDLHLHNRNIILFCKQHVLCKIVVSFRQASLTFCDTCHDINIITFLFNKI